MDCSVLALAGEGGVQKIYKQGHGNASQGQMLRLHEVEKCHATSKVAEQRVDSESGKQLFYVALWAQ